MRPSLPPSRSVSRDKDAQGRFRLQTKRLFLTYPHHQGTPEALKDHILRVLPSPAYILAARERHMDGDWHLHAYAETSVRFRTSDPFYFDFQGRHGHYQSARGNMAQVQRYLTKEGLANVVEWQSPEWTRPRSVYSTAQRNLEILRSAPQEWIERGLVGIQNYQRMSASVNQYRSDRDPRSLFIPKECLWIFGPPRVGKSRMARELLPQAYWKSLTHWWDGYSGQDEVIIDDVDRSCRYDFFHSLKIWADTYSFRGEVKGGHVLCTFTKLIVTANYSPDELIQGDESLLAAIKGRFSLEYMGQDGQMESVDW